MEWQPEVKKLYESMVLSVPEMVRPAVKPALFEAAEKKCEDRNGKEVAEMDLVVALFEVTPPAFQPTMIEDLQNNGVDYNKYLPKVESGFKHNTDLDQVVKDMVKLCELTGLKSNTEAIRKVLTTYDKFFRGAPLSIRTTSKPVEKRDVSLRYVEMMIPHKPDPYTTAIEAGLLERNGHPIHEMIVESINTFDMMGYGVDLNASTGLAKIWPFIVPGSIEPIFSMKSIPSSMKNYIDYFNRHGLTAFSLFAFDFLHNTTNIYFMIENDFRADHDSCKSLVEELGFDIQSEELIEYCRDAVHLNYTFSWDSEKVERLCFGMTCHDADKVPVHLHPIIKEFVDNSPFQSEVHKFIYSIAYTANGFYYKIENDYTGSMVDFLTLGTKAGLKKYN